jgi:hypothetical protein
MPALTALADSLRLNGSPISVWVSPTPPILIEYGALTTLAGPEDYEIPLFPPIEGFFWPPKHSFTNETLNRYAARMHTDSP